MNPVRARLSRRAGDWPWSSARAHLRGRDDKLVKVRALLELTERWDWLLAEGMGRGEVAAMGGHERTGRPLGDEAFVRKLERRLHRALWPAKGGPKKKRRKRN